MADVLGHRGPDDARLVELGRVIFGHTRLSIIDLKTGAQPMSTDDDALWVVFNGEIYNYIELRDELRAAGHRFRTDSDTETVLLAYREWGDACVSRLNGQWAFALFDRRGRRLFLSRDPVGIRPLYYTIAHGSLLFASEIKALLMCPSVRRSLCPHGLAQTLTFWSPIPPLTAFEGIRQLEPGCSMIVPAGTEVVGSDSVEIMRHYAPHFGANDQVRGAPLEENAARFRELFERAVRLRFNRSDVPVGAYLSGGLDSSVTTAVVSRIAPSRLETFSLTFDDRQFDESSYQRRVSEALGTRHRSIRVSNEDIARVFPQVVYHAEQPVLRTAPAPMFLLSELVRSSNYRVVVTGEGSDEVLGGYDIYRETLVRRFIGRNPDSQRRRDILLYLYPWMERSPTKAPAFAQAFFGEPADPSDPALSHRPRWRTTSQLLRLLDPDFGAPTAPIVEDELLDGLPAELYEWHPLEQAQYLEMTTLLSGYLLSAQGDRMLMGHSVEGRFPFLDPTLLRFAESLPPRHKVMGLDEKHILKYAYGSLLPSDIVSRPKQPYRAPDAAAFFADGRSPDWFADLLSPASVRAAGIFNPTAVESLCAKCRSRSGLGMSNTDNMRIVAVASTMLLHHQFIRGSALSSTATDSRAASGARADS